jgi:hypothetical protein
MNNDIKNDKQFLAKWSVIRPRGMSRYICLYGILFSGGLFFLASALMIWINTEFTMRLIAERGISSILFGTMFGTVAWFKGERRYANLLKRTQQVDSAEASTIAVPPFSPSGSPR